MLVGVVHHVQHGFQPGHGGHVQIAHAHIGVHAAGVVLMTICAPLRCMPRRSSSCPFPGPVRLTVSTLAAPLSRPPRAGVVGAAGAQDQHGLARKIHAVGLAR